MKSCRIRVAVVLILLLTAAGLFVPVKTLDVSYRRDPRTNLVWKTASDTSGFQFLPKFLKRERGPIPEETSYAVRYALRRSLEVRTLRTRLNPTAVAVEAGLLVVLAAFDFLVLCRRKRDRAGDPFEREARPVAPGDPEPPAIASPGAGRRI